MRYVLVRWVVHADTQAPALASTESDVPSMFPDNRASGGKAETDPAVPGSRALPIL